MTVSLYLAALHTALASLLGPDAEISLADDDWAALSIMTGSAPGKVRVVILCGDLVAVSAKGNPTGAVCQLTTRIVVQARRGMAKDAGAKIHHQLLDMEQAVRLAALSWTPYQEDTSPPGIEDLARGQGAHPTAGQLMHLGSGAYDSPLLGDGSLDHPAREVRFQSLIALHTPGEPHLVPLPH